MVNKMIYFFVLVSALVLAGSASAVELFWDKGGAGNLWNDPAAGIPKVFQPPRIQLGLYSQVTQINASLIPL